MTDEREEETDPTDIVPAVEMALVEPVALEKVVAAFRAFEKMKKGILTEADWQWIGKKARMMKSGVLKVALACNLSLEKREERVERDGDVVVYHYTYRAIAPSGRFADADGSASSDEKRFAHVPHDVRTLAQTRSCNRAIVNLTGGGEVTFEEITPETGQADVTTADLDEAGIVDALEGMSLDADDLEISIDLEGMTKVKPRQFLGDAWDRYNQAMWKIGLGWIRDEKQWRGKAQMEVP